MTLKFFVAVTIFATLPIVAFAQKDDPANRPPKPTVEDAQKVVQTISSGHAIMRWLNQLETNF